VDREPIGCVGQALQCQVKATLDPEPTPDEKKLMKYEWNLESAKPSESLPHFALSDKGVSANGLESMMVNLDGSVPAGYHTANVSLTVYGKDNKVLASDSTGVKFTVVKVDLVDHSNPHCWDGGQITFTAVPAPSGASFPSGCPTWTTTVGSFAGGGYWRTGSVGGSKRVWRGSNDHCHMRVFKC